MSVRKPISVKEKPVTSFDQITPEFLAEKERHWEEVRMKELTLANLKEVGADYFKAKAIYDRAVFECKIRAMRAVNLGYDKKELADAMGVPVRTITKWANESKK